MAYATKYYDYQIAIIFAILLAGLLLLALVVGAIYFICVVNMRGKKGGISRMPSGRRTPATRLEWTQSPPHQQYIVAPQSQQQQYDTGYGQQPPQQQQYIPPTPQQQYEASVAAARVRELQPDYFQQQGPITYVSHPAYEQQQQQSYPQQQPMAAQSYHMSSV